MILRSEIRLVFLKKRKGAKDELLRKLLELDHKIDQGYTGKVEAELRITLVKEIADINKVQALDMEEKAKVRWAIEGDENRKYFHGIVNKKT